MLSTFSPLFAVTYKMVSSSLAFALATSALFETANGASDLLEASQENAQKNYINASVPNAAKVELQISTKAPGRNETGDSPSPIVQVIL